VFKIGGSENMAKAGGTLLNNEVALTVPALDGSSTIYGRGVQLNLQRSFTCLVGVEDNNFDGTTSISSNKTTIHVDRVIALQGAQKTYKFNINETGMVKHTPQNIVLKLKFSNVAIDIDDFSSYRVLLSVFWGSSSEVQAIDYVAANRSVGGNSITSIADIDTYFVASSSSNNNAIVLDSNNSGNLPEKVEVKFEFNASDGGPNDYDIDFDCTPEFFVNTQLDESDTNVQSTSEIIDNIKELYSGQDGHSLDSALITKPIAAHRYLCETFMSSEFGSTPPSSYDEILAHDTTARGTLHYYINKQEKLEDVLKKLQHFGAFIMRYKSDGTFEYQSASHLSTSTTASTTKPYLLNIGTLQTVGGSGIDADDTAFGVDITHASETLSNGDIIAVVPSSGNYEFIKVFVTDVAISGADIPFSACERNLLPSNVNTSVVEDAPVFKVMFPHTKITDNDFKDLQISHLPLDKIITRYKINYHRNPSSNKYLELSEYTDSTNSTTYNIATETVKEINNEIDVTGTLSDYYYHHYGSLSNGPKIKISLNIINPSFYGIEVGDIIKFDGGNTTQTPFGLAAKGLTGSPNAFDRLYFIVTSTSRTLGKISVSAYEIY
jgi:uncharacterized protein (UPF0335 family)